jgi:opacity protein-like surface antigen
MVGTASLVASFCFCIPSLAPAQSASAADGRWTYEITPYLWGAGVTGAARVGPRAPEANVDASFSDLADSLSAGLMGTFEARRDRWGILFDLIYIKLSADSEPLLGGRLGTASADFSQNILQLAGAYRAYDNSVTSVDAVLGARYTYLKSELGLSPSALLPAGAQRDRSENWTDGFVGVRAAHKLSDKWRLIGYADIGGGGSDKSWQLIAGANYDFKENMSAKFGYRIIRMDFDEPDFLYNAKTSGVYVGLGFRF